MKVIKKKKAEGTHRGQKGGERKRKIKIDIQAGAPGHKGDNGHWV